ncbi:MAG: Fe-S metabolism protein SufE [Verrucomicrobia bacterium]|nr:Fe-S metabolism protein SufE [Verrucomicrobiota bacterium]
MARLPPALAELVAFFEGLTETQRRETLWSFAEESNHLAPREGELSAVIDDRTEPDCVDAVTLFLGIGPNGGLRLRATFGAGTQTLTRALVAILCRGLDGADLALAAELPDDFIPRIVGEPLLRSRSRSVHRLTGRLREAVRRLAGGVPGSLSGMDPVSPQLFTERQPGNA